MKSLKLKVCGMRDPENIQELVEIGPDFIGFIFYPKSPRFVEGLNLSESAIPNSIKKVGVFVNTSVEEILEKVATYQLDYVQLHGDESLDFARLLKNEGQNIIKVFRVEDTFPEAFEEFEEVSDLFLFDTATSNYGGSGHQFNWELLQNYSLSTPFLLSGGISLEDIPEIKKLDHEHLVGIDVNSRFELEPGLKDMDLIRRLKEAL